MNMQMQPLYWRLNEHARTGLNQVSLLMPTNQDADTALEFPMQVCCSARNDGLKTQDVSWSEDDVDLFFSLLERLLQTKLEGNIELDLTDKSVQAIMKLVAQVRFQKAWDMAELEGEDLNVQRDELAVGDLVAINSCYGFPSAIVVALDSIEACCVLFSPVLLNGKKILTEHSLVRLSRLSVLPSIFADDAEGKQHTCH